MSAPQPESPSAAAPLPAPAELRARFPISTRVARLVRTARDGIRAVLHGCDRARLVMVVGPCSIHDPVSALEYARALAVVARNTEDALLIVMRTYLDKPRTTLGWKGLIRDPWLDGSDDLGEGFSLARRLLCDISELGVPCATELLDPFSVPYLEDLLSWGVIGARTSESQTHRELASGLDLPVGFKNGMRGDLGIARDAMIAAREPAVFVAIDLEGRACVTRTRGNRDCHLVLRGGTRPNHGPKDVRCASELVADQGIARPIMVDCSHGNSGKDPSRQPGVLRVVLAQLADPSAGIMGAMLESHLRPGHQDLRPGRPLAYGISITDGCLGWHETEQLLYEAAAAVRTRRGGT